MGKFDEFSGTIASMTIRTDIIKPPDTIVVDLGHSNDIRRQYHGIKHINLIYDGAEHVYDSAEFMRALGKMVGDETCYFIPSQKGFTWWDEDDVEHFEEDSASDECYTAHCDHCGFEMLVRDEGWFRGWDDIAEWTEEDGSVHKGYVLDPIFKFCPSCGYRVKTFRKGNRAHDGSRLV